jgi:hypothetical protein
MGLPGLEPVVKDKFSKDSSPPCKRKSFQSSLKIQVGTMHWALAVFSHIMGQRTRQYLLLPKPSDTAIIRRSGVWASIELASRPGSLLEPLCGPVVTYMQNS